MKRLLANIGAVYLFLVASMLTFPTVVSAQDDFEVGTEITIMSRGEFVTATVTGTDERGRITFNLAPSFPIHRLTVLVVVSIPKRVLNHCSASAALRKLPLASFLRSSLAALCERPDLRPTLVSERRQSRSTPPQR